jgi:hypothetical protein
VKRKISQQRRMVEGRGEKTKEGSGGGKGRRGGAEGQVRTKVPSTINILWLLSEEADVVPLSADDVGKLRRPLRVDLAEGS